LAQRHIHYEAAFEDYIRSRGWPYIPIDEQKKAIFSGARVKSFDFLVYPRDRKPWLVDIKGRKFPYDSNGSKRYWENWVTQEDIDGLRSWHRVFGDGFETVFIFAYWLVGGTSRLPCLEVHSYKNEQYAFIPVSATDYEQHARMRSPKWNTISVSTKNLKLLARKMDVVEVI